MFTMNTIDAYGYTSRWLDIDPQIGLFTGSLNNPFKLKFTEDGKDKCFGAITFNWDSSFAQQIGGPLYLQKGLESGCDMMLVNINQQHPKYKDQDERDKLPIKPTIGIETSEITLSPTGESLRLLKQTLMCFKLVDGQWVRDDTFKSRGADRNSDDYVKINPDGTIEIIATKYGEW